VRVVDGIVSEKATTTAQVASDAAAAESPEIPRPFRSRLWMYAFGAVIVVGLGIMMVWTVSPRNPAPEIPSNSFRAKPPGVMPSSVSETNNPPTAPAPPRSPAPEEAVSTADAVKRASDAFGRKDYAEAMRWYRQAADGGDADSQSKVGILYENGWGVVKNPSEALR
jgi:hypothetical protein